MGKKSVIHSGKRNDRHLSAKHRQSRLSNAFPDFRDTVDARVLWKPSHECAWPFRPDKRLFSAIASARVWDIGFQNGGGHLRYRSHCGAD
jgi:hypothetical protein